MKYPKIDLKEVRQQAKQFQAEHPRLLLVFLLPSIFLILSSFISPLSLLDEGILEQSFFTFLMRLIKSSLFPLAVGFTSSIILAGALLALGILVPGLSPSNLLLILGLYTPMLTGFKTFDLFGTFLPIGIGAAATLIIFSKFIEIPQSLL